jgi:hypothetical protein
LDFSFVRLLLRRHRRSLMRGDARLAQMIGESFRLRFMFIPDNATK